MCTSLQCQLRSHYGGQCNLMADALMMAFLDRLGLYVSRALPYGLSIDMPS